MIYLLILLVILIIGYIYSSNHSDFFANDFFTDDYGPSFGYVAIMIVLCAIIIFGGMVYFDSIGIEDFIHTENTMLFGSPIVFYGMFQSI